MQSHDLSELGLLGVFLATAVGFTVLTFDFRSSSAALFPRLMAGVIIVGVVLLLAREYLPGPLQRIVAEPVSLVDQEELETDSTAERTGQADLEADREGDASATEGGEPPLTPRQFTFVAITGYIGIAYLLSILLATPLFVLAYAAWFRHRWTTALALTAVSVLIVFLFIELANAPLGDGLLLPGGGL